MKNVFVILLILLPLTMKAENSNVFGNAQWIGATADAADTQAGKSIWLRRSFQCHKPIKQATLYVCGLGSYEIYLNYKKINDDLFAPAWSDYKKSVYYNVIDMTENLHFKNTVDPTKITKSVNMLYVLLGNGFYHEDGERYHKLKTNYGPLSLRFHLVIKYEDGSIENINSDDKQWFVRQSPITYNSLYGGEDYDATIEGYTDKSPAYEWRPAVVQMAPKGVLRQQISEPVKVMERYPVAKKLPNGVYDMGQNMSGFPLIGVRGEKGQVVKIIVGESLSADGHVSQKLTGSPHTYSYTIRGKQKSPFNDDIVPELESKVTELWHPHFSYYGFRYIEVQGAVSADDPNPYGLPVIDDLQACFVSNSAKKVGRFECSNSLFNDTYKIIDKAIRSNWMSVWTDCPHREKLGWLEQDWLNGPGLMCNYDCKKMYQQEMQVIADAIHTDGSMPEIAPEYIRFEGTWAPPFQESPEWGGALIAIPYMYEKYYGDKSLIDTYRPQMTSYFNYLASKAKNNILDMGLGDWYDYGEGKPGFSKNTSVPLVATAHYYRWATTLGLKDKADAIKKAFIANCVPNSQAGYSIAIVLGLYEDGQKKKLVDALVADIHKHGDKLTTGDVGTPYLFKALLDNGQGDLLFKMLDKYEAPGYGCQIDKGMTTLAECWNPEQASSKNHFMLATINNHLIQDVVGIHVSKSGIEINPRLVGNLIWAKGSTATAYGDVSVFWRIRNGEFFIDIATPNRSLTNINYEEINNMCAARGLKLQYNIRQK